MVDLCPLHVLEPQSTLCVPLSCQPVRVGCAAMVMGSQEHRWGD